MTYIQSYIGTNKLFADVPFAAVAAAIPELTALPYFATRKSPFHLILYEECSAGTRQEITAALASVGRCVILFTDSWHLRACLRELVQ
jgi:hypothetical protein